jgi:hypothetical protein
MKKLDLLNLLDSWGEAEFNLILPDKTFIEPHFHITEVGSSLKHFVDCGNNLRVKQTCVLQVWVASDVNHRLKADKLANIIRQFDDLKELEVEIEYGTPISLYTVDSAYENTLVLGNTQTNCLAPDKCGIEGCNTKGCC